ncbi:MAG: DHHA1 domain-containing protein [Candidatus Binatia bacterium]|nr:DHHA1 domain-containing protein [Candidatus Binatia bacterium]
MTQENRPRYLHVVSHGPQCLDGVTAAVVLASFHPQCEVEAVFCSNTGVNHTLREFRCEPKEAEHEIWITDISWVEPEVDQHLTELQKQGVRLYWIDHHRTALERYRSGGVHVPFTDLVLDESFAASRLVYDYLRRTRPLAAEPSALSKLVAMADDNDRWLHQIPDSHALALAVNAMNSPSAYDELLAFARTGKWSERLRAAYATARQDVSRSIALAERSRVELAVPEVGVVLVTAVCDGYPSEVADHWNRSAERTVFALFDLRAHSVSFRRSPDCSVDVSQIAKRLGGGGHPAAAGCELPALLQDLAQALAREVVPVLRRTS